MKDDYLLRTKGALRLYNDFAKALPIIDFHNHLDVRLIKEKKSFDNATELWIAPDPYKHRLMRISGIDEYFITGNANPYEKFERFCAVFPYLAGNPVYDWSRMELSSVFGIDELPSEKNASRLYEKIDEMLHSPEFSATKILSRFGIEYQSPIASLTDDLSYFDGRSSAPSLRGDNLLSPTDELKRSLSEKTGIKITDTASYVKAVCVLLDEFGKKGCRFADHALDSGFFDGDTERAKMLCTLGNEYASRGWTLLLHIDAKRKTSSRLARLAGPFGGFAAVGGTFPTHKLCDLLGSMEERGKLPDTVLFPLNMSDIPQISVMQGSFSEDGTPSKVGIGPAWWWCDHSLGIKTTLNSVASFGVLSRFIGMTTDSRSILSFVRHDYFRRILCSWFDELCESSELDLPYEVAGEIITKISYTNAYEKIHKGERK